MAMRLEYFISPFGDGAVFKQVKFTLGCEAIVSVRLGPLRTVRIRR